ncbi:hypothetical protein HanIR_Chr10g0472701 [Helianthus annuus]|nr:hypothetical protein HanIR_Chr10g0472701 [Helianthus annuus]
MQNNMNGNSFSHLFLNPQIQWLIICNLKNTEVHFRRNEKRMVIEAFFQPPQLPKARVVADPGIFSVIS